MKSSVTKPATAVEQCQVKSRKYILIGLGSLSNSSDMLVVVNSQYKTQIWPTLCVNLNFKFFNII